MRAMALERPGPVASAPLRALERPEPEPGPGQISIDVSVCGVCRTDLHVVEGDLEPQRASVVPGHQIVGRVRACGPGATRFTPGTRVGVAWLAATCGRCRFCADPETENLCRAPLFTGWHVDGGYAERALAHQAFAYALPEIFSDAEAAPLLCAGIIGFRALRRSGIRPGQRLGLYGFGSSAHIALQVARHWGCRAFVATRGETSRALARELGAVWVGEADEPPPEPLDAAILFAPAGGLVPPALRALGPGATLACAGIHMSAIPELDYSRELFDERSLTSVTANTRSDGEALLAIAAEIPIRPHTTRYPLDEANRALADLAAGRFAGSAVLEVGGAR